MEASAPSEVYDAVIVGGGLAGLSAAWFLRHRRILLLEARPRVGGRVMSVRDGGYWVNLGAQLFPGEDAELSLLAELLGVCVLPVPGSFLSVLDDGRILNPRRPEALLFKLRLSPRERLAFLRAAIKLRRATRAFGAGDRGVAAHSAPARARHASFLDDQTFADFLGPLPPRVDAIFRTIAHRASAEPEELSAGAAITVIAGVLSPKRGASLLARTVKGGTEQIIEAIADKLAGRIACGCAVNRVRTREDGVLIDCSVSGTGRTFMARHVVLATPAPVTRSILDPPEPLDSALASVVYGAFVSMGIFTSEKQRTRWDDIYALTTPGCSFDFVFNHANVLRRPEERQPGGSLMLYCGGPRAAALCQDHDAEIERTYLADLFRVFPELRGKVRDTTVQRWPIGTALSAPGRAQLQPIIERGVASQSIHLAGDYLYPLGSMEAATQSGMRAAKSVETMLGQRSLAASAQL
jgi:oxygen-dependent protoporphyrinogen oxidase